MKPKDKGVYRLVYIFNRNLSMKFLLRENSLQAFFHHGATYWPTMLELTPKGLFPNFYK